MISYKAPILVLLIGLLFAYLFSSHIHSLVSVKTLHKWKKYIPDEVVNFFHQKESKVITKTETAGQLLYVSYHKITSVFYLVKYSYKISQLQSNPKFLFKFSSL